MAMEVGHRLGGDIRDAGRQRHVLCARDCRARITRPNDRSAPFGGCKQSGNGREWGRFGLEEYLEVKAIAGFSAT